MSVNLYSKHPLHLLEGVLIGLTKESRASSLLLQTLIKKRFNIHALYEEIEKPFLEYEAFLLIGNSALANPHFPGYSTYDLATLWHEWTKLPFTFALFAYEESDAGSFEKTLNDVTSRIDLDAITLAALTELPISRDRLNEYFSNLTFRLGKKEIESLLFFKETINEI